ncbi:MAG TPA: hypothetical protein VKU02_04370 [Gemmataceae bacterium]|nr:hypothetical protein [Gemmataceae bacterium]
MAASLDKDTFIKHSFWMLAGFYVVLVLACLTVLATSVGDTVRKEEEDVKNAEKTVTSINDPKNDSVVEAYKKQDQYVDGKKDKVWKDAWETQKDMMTWPRELQARFQRYKYFGEPIDLADRYEFDQQYDKQFRDVYEVVQPVDAKGEGVVQCKGGEWESVLNLAKSFNNKPISKDDIWLAQEELWVKRELLRILREANDSVAHFKEVKPESAAEKESKEVKAGPVAEKDAKPAKTETAALEKDQKGAKPIPAAKTDPNHKIFRNPYWEFDLTLADSGGGKFVISGKLTNITRRKQTLESKFKVLLQDPATVAEPSFELLSVEGLPLTAGESKEIKPKPVSEQKAIAGLFGVEQVLNWKTAAVKRLDELQLMYMSSRTIRELKPPRFISSAPAEGSDPSAAAAGDTGATGATPSPGGAERTTPLPGSFASAGTTQTLNGMEINRYTDVSDQVRHMPVAMVVIVDEERLPELLAAFVNSRLRIQVTQYHWQHCRDHMNPNVNEGGPQFSPSSPTGPRASMPTPGATMPPGASLAGGRRIDYNAKNPLGGAPARGERDRSRPPGPAGPQPRLSAAGPSGPMPRSGMGANIIRGSGAGSVASEDEEQEDLNLLEVAVYGLASLYERYPPAPKPAEQSSTPDDKQPAASAPGSK